jgi:DNA adenine methylase
MQKTPLSVLDVPGSKLWLVPWMRAYLACWRKPKRFIEIFAGSATVGFSLLAEGRVSTLVLCEKDPDYAAVWHTLFGPRPDSQWLIDQILTLAVWREEVRAWLAQPAPSARERALQTLVKSRCYHRGRLTSGGGLLPQTSRRPGGASIARGWNPTMLAQRIRSLRDLRRRLTVVEGCGLQCLEAHLDDASAFVYADPPYKSAGKKLYRHFEVDMARLLRACAQAKGHVLISYEDDQATRQLAACLGLCVQEVPMHTAEGTGKQELLVSNRPLPTRHMTPATLARGSDIPVQRL